uniref:Uncharacterized protein n=1 Tax=Arundo donax TaxID=35708 RepID=A0A0A9H143_ARUDO
MRRCARWRARPRWTTTSGCPTGSSTPSSPYSRWSPNRSCTGYRSGTW